MCIFVNEYVRVLTYRKGVGEKLGQDGTLVFERVIFPIHGQQPDLRCNQGERQLSSLRSIVG